MFGTELKTCVKVQYLNHYFNGNHSHPYYELVYYFKGNGKVNVAGEVYPFGAGTYSVSRPETFHNEEGEKDTHLIYISFTLNNFELENGLYHDKSGAIGKLIFECYKELQSKQPLFQLILNNLAERIILQHMRFNLNSEKKKDDNFEYALNYININATQNITVKEISRNIGYNYNYFRELFFKKTSVSLKDYLIDKKLKCAQNLLRSTDYSIAEIASMSGFASSSHFCTVFKKAVGATPQTYKEQAENFAYADIQNFLPPEYAHNNPSADLLESLKSEYSKNKN